MFCQIENVWTLLEQDCNWREMHSVARVRLKSLKIACQRLKNFQRIWEWNWKYPHENTNIPAATDWKKVLKMKTWILELDAQGRRERRRLKWIDWNDPGWPKYQSEIHVALLMPACLNTDSTYTPHT